MTFDVLLAGAATLVLSAVIIFAMTWTKRNDREDQ